MPSPLLAQACASARLSASAVFPHRLHRVEQPDLQGVESKCDHEQDECGGTAQSHTDQCYDTVAGGPFIAAAGGGAAYDLGPILLLGSLTAHLGVPDMMLNVDALLGVGLRL